MAHGYVHSVIARSRAGEPAPVKGSLTPGNSIGLIVFIINTYNSSL